jgi:hypothetical protein
MRVVTPRLLIVAVCVLGLSTSAVPAQDKTAIAVKFEKGKTFYQEVTTKTTQSMKVMNTDVTQTQEQTFTFAWTYTDEDKDKNWIVTQKITGVKMKIDIGNNPISFDSTNPATGTNALSSFFNALVGAEFKLTIDPKTNKVTKVEGREDFVKKLSAVNQQMEPLLKTILTDEALRQMAEPIFGVAPKDPVAKGATWSKDSDLSLGPIGSYKSKNEYTLDKIEKDVASIKVKTELTYKAPAADAGGALPFKIKSADLKSKPAEGTLTFNVAKGRLEKSTLKVNLEGTLDIEIGGTANKVELRQEQETTVTTSDTDPLKKS